MHIIFTDEHHALEFPKVDFLTAEAFECSVCADDKEKGSPYVLAAGDPVCKECWSQELEPQFEAALSDEEKYPVMWADRLPSDIAKEAYDMGHPDEDADYEEARRLGPGTGECGYFLGSASDDQKSIQCDFCRGESCGKCREPLGFEEKIEKHKCDPAKKSSELDTIPKNLVRGKDYQICPNPICERIWCLRDGCNAMVCGRCRTAFCFICGQEAKERTSHHWDSGKPCPHWGQPGSSQALSDGHGPEPERVDPPLDLPDFGVPIEIDRALVNRAERLRRGMSYVKHLPSDEAIASGKMTPEEWEGLRRLDHVRIAEALVAVAPHQGQAEIVIQRFGEQWLPRLSALTEGKVDDSQKKWKPVDPKALYEQHYNDKYKAPELLDALIEGKISELHFATEHLRDGHAQIMAQDPVVYDSYSIDPRMVERWIERMPVFEKQWSDMRPLAEKWAEEEREAEEAAEALRQLEIAKEEEETIRAGRRS